MRKTVSLSILLFIGLCFISCRITQEKKVMKVSEDFLEYFNSKDFDKARDLVTPNGVIGIDILKSFGNMDETEEPSKPVIVILSCTIKGDSAQCYYTSDGKRETLNLIKIDGKWLVDFMKESPDAGTYDEQNVAYPDSAVASETYYNEEQIVRDSDLFEFELHDMENYGSAAYLTFRVRNNSEYDIRHLWLELYFSDKQGRFITKREVMFDMVLNSVPYNDDPGYSDNVQEYRVSIEAVDVTDIGEIFIIPLRFTMDESFYYSFYDAIDAHNLSHEYTKITNSTNYELVITY